MRFALALIPLLFLALVAVAPVARLLAEGWGTGELGFWALWADDYLRGRVLWSLAQAGITSVAALLVGVPLAWVLARIEFTGRALVLRALMLPFVVPTLVAAMGVLALAGPRGVLGVDGSGTPWLLLYGNLFFNLCLVVRAGVEAFEHVSGTRVAAARTLGASPWRVFRRVEWPEARPWLASAACLVFLYCLSGFGLALVLGGQRWATAEVEIYTLVAHELALGQAGVLAVWMLLLNGAVALIYAFIEQRLAAPARAVPIPLRAVASRGDRLAVAALHATLFALAGAPLLALLLRTAPALLDGAAWAVLRDPATLQALFNTLRFSAMALALALVLGVAHALSAQGLRRLGLAWRAAAFLPFVVSPVTVAFGLLLLYPAFTASLPLLVAAYALIAYPFIARALAAALDALPPSLAQAAATLGASPARVAWRVTLPLVAPALRRGTAFAAATMLGEFAVSLFLSRPEWLTLTTLIHQRLGRPGETNLQAALVLALLLLALALAAFVLIEGGTRRQAPPHARTA
ncbi:ABC transporter permease [Hydrogenophaga intermedia]|uniref:Binding-protein-dependent transport systems inner membrane component n=1 Tax=Hydrogenophaga intermedia TaxID=65786 RepID=A0A1L1PU86_HYDIT|nr:iron ABC transporter permease [Hydrogenophaga intermedia]TMU74590.1 iron ABC transporter permease [Hydrogenophaga intermedia]CDN88211.1 Binding-protein-dependent transport systems inner membrane component [Hydrogenophaga intermedia]